MLGVRIRILGRNLQACSDRPDIKSLSMHLNGSRFHGSFKRISENYQRLQE
jgi:hypothetical protein